LDYLKEKESLQFEFHRKYEKSKYSSAAGLPTLTSFRKIRIGCKMISRKRLQKEKDRLRRWFEVSIWTLVITAYLPLV
jgi:hypothetical protein